MAAIVSPEDEFIHRDFPRGEGPAWKENWYFNIVDRANCAWGACHISLRRHEQRGKFVVLLLVDEVPVFYGNDIDLAEDFANLTDGRIKVEIVEPHKKHRLTLDTEKFKLDLHYTSRFGVFNYRRDDSTTDFVDANSLAIEHYEQAMAVEGTLAVDGSVRPISCWGHRDHSWGYRNEENVRGWNWVAAQFQNKTINLSLVSLPEAQVAGGFVSTVQGNKRIQQVGVRSTFRDDDGIPTGSIYDFLDEDGRAWTLRSSRFSHVEVPVVPKGEGSVHEVFAEFELLETGETGVGVDEYMQNSNP